MASLDKINTGEQQAVAVRQPHRRTALIVAGMHRSGTSAITRVLNLLGCDTAKNLVPADQFNQRGYWESPGVAALNDRILASQGLAWDSWESIDAQWFASAKADEFRAEAAELLDLQFGRSGLLVLKDPRICRLLPFWTSVLEASDIAPHVVLTVRRPTEVAASLLTRNGLNPSLAQLVWLRYVLEAEAYSRGLPRAYVRYDDLLGDWRGVISRLGESIGGFNWPRRSAATLMEIDQFLSPSLRHHDSEVQNEGLAVDFSPWVRETWRIMAGWAAGDANEADEARLDFIHNALNGAEQSFARVILEHQRHGVQLSEELEALRRRVEDLQAPRIDPAVSRLQAEKASLADEIEKLRAQGADRAAEVERLNEALSAARSAPAVIPAHVTEALKLAEERFIRKDQQAAEFKQQLRQLAREITAKEDEARGLRQGIAVRDERLDVSERALAKLQAAHASLAEDLASTREALTRGQDLLETRQRELSTALARATVLSNEAGQHRATAERLQAEAAEAAGRIAELQATLAERTEAAESCELLFAEARGVISVQQQENARLHLNAEMMRRLIAGNTLLNHDTPAEPAPLPEQE